MEVQNDAQPQALIVFSGLFKILVGSQETIPHRGFLVRIRMYFPFVSKKEIVKMLAEDLLIFSFTTSVVIGITILVDEMDKPFNGFADKWIFRNGSQRLQIIVV